MYVRANRYTLFFFLSIALHLVLFVPLTLDLTMDWAPAPREISKLNIKSIDFVDFIKRKGDIESLEEKGKDSASQRRNPILTKPKDDINEQKSASDLKLSDLAGKFNPKRPTARGLLAKRARKVDTMSTRQIKQFIADAPGKISAADMLKQLGNNDISVSFGIPEGMEQDEFNQAEMVFFSFRRRLALAYVSTFFDKLGEFNIQNPHLQFPMTQDEELMTGQVTYDRGGNIVRIRMVRWTEKQKLQDFFVEVLESMSSLPNPPDQIIQDGEFTVFYSLNIKN